MKIEQLIKSFSTEDCKKFISFLQKKNRRTDVKNVVLFKLLYKEELNSEEICKQLYPKALKKDAYHALRKRLYESVINFLASENLEEENTDKVAVIKYILVAKSFLQQKQFSLGFSILNKATVIAKEYQLYAYLNEIYHVKIEYADMNLQEPLDELIHQFKENQQLYILEEELNIVYAKIKDILRKISNEGAVIDFQKIVLGILNEQQITIDSMMSFKSLYKLLTIASISAFVTKDYLQVESFMLEMYALLKEHPNKEKGRFYHIQVLYMIANTLFRTKQFEKSMEFLALMKYEILQNRRAYHRLFMLKYELLYALNLNYTKKQDLAIEHFESILKKKHSDVITVLDIQLSLVVFYAQSNEFSKAYKLLSKLRHTDAWYTEKVGKEWVIKKSLIELLLLVELDYLDLFESRFLRFKRQFGAYLKEIGQERVLIFLQYVDAYYRKPTTITTEDFFDKVENSFEWVGPKQEDIFVMSFYAWLKSKMIEEPLYKVTLDLIAQAQQL